MTNRIPALVRWKRRVPGFLMSAPAVILFITMFLIPTILGVYLSLTDWTGFSLNFNFIGLENYEKAFTTPRARDAVIFTAVQAVVVTVIINVLGVALAVIIGGNGKINTLSRVVFFYPGVISGLVIGFLWSAILAPQGVINSLFTQIGWPTLPFLADPSFAKVMVIFTIAWASFGFNMILYIAGLKAIPGEYYEAATVDGAGSWQRFRHITLPLLAPIVTVNVVLNMVGLLRTYDLVLSLTNGGPAASTQTIVFQIIQNAFMSDQRGLGAAQSVGLLVVTAVVGLAVTFYRRRAEAKVSE